jgi:hypothetical protein
MLEPDLTRPDGIWHDDTREAFLEHLEHQPGAEISYDQVDHQRILSMARALSESSEGNEKQLVFNFGGFSQLMAVMIEPKTCGTKMQTEVVLGAYGIVAHSIRNDNLDIPLFKSNQPPKKQPSRYCPEEVALIGRTDLVMSFGHGSGKKKGSIIAVLEAKLVNSATDFHQAGNALCTQINLSMIGSEAPVGIALGPNTAKYFRRSESKGNIIFSTYPAGGAMADLTDPEELSFFCKFAFHLTRCCLMIRDGLAMHAVKPECDNVASFDRNGGSSKPPEGPLGPLRTWGLSKAIKPVRKNIQKVSGLITRKLAKLDLSHWCEEELEGLTRHLIEQDEIIKEEQEYEKWLSR